MFERDFLSLRKARTRAEVDEIVSRLQGPKLRISVYVEASDAESYVLVIHAAKGPYYKGTIKLEISIGGDVLNACRY